MKYLVRGRYHNGDVGTDCHSLLLKFKGLDIHAQDASWLVRWGKSTVEAGALSLMELRDSITFRADKRHV